MEYSFCLSELFPDKVSVIGNDLIPVGCPILSLKEVRESVVRERTTEIVNSMGRLSAEAQSLSSIVTSADRLREGDYKLYLYCDFISNKVLGFLKIGKKKLYAFDSSGAQHEIGPMCVLDFHIVNSRQRHGAGKYLFDYMLRNESIPVEHFAFDSPSDKFLLFLKKHYNLTKVFALANNFCIFDGFFTNRDDYSGKREPWHGLSQTPDILHQVAFSKEKESRMENSRDYNHHEPLIHHGQMRADYVNPSNVSNFGDTPQFLTQNQHPESQTDEQRRHVTAAGYGHGDSQHYRQHYNEKKDGGQKQNFTKQEDHESKDDGQKKDVSLSDTQQPHEQHQEMNEEQRRHDSSVGYGHGDTHQYRQHHTEIKDGGQKVIEVIKQQEHDGQEQHVVSNGDTPQNHEMNEEQRRLVSAVGYGHGENQLLHEQNNKKKDSREKKYVNKYIKQQHEHNMEDVKRLNIADKNQIYQENQTGGEYTYSNGEVKSE